MHRIGNYTNDQRPGIVPLRGSLILKPMKNNEDLETPAMQLCPSCKGAGYLRVDVPFEHPQFGKPASCHCHIERLKQEKQQ